MLEPDSPMITSNATAPAASFAIASSAELYDAIWTDVWNFFSNRFTTIGST